MVGLFVGLLVGAGVGETVGEGVSPVLVGCAVVGDVVGLSKNDVPLENYLFGVLHN